MNKKRGHGVLTPPFVAALIKSIDSNDVKYKVT